MATGSFDQNSASIWRYDRVAMVLHWVIALLILGNLAGGLLADAIEDAVGFSIIPVHKSIGMTVLVLSILRLVWRLSHRPAPLPHGPGWERVAATAVHWLFYGYMILMPLTGWMMSSAGKYPITWFGIFPIAKLPIAKGSPAAEFGHDGHMILGFSLLALVILHIAAALRHRFVLRDGMTRRMGLP